MAEARPADRAADSRAAAAAAARARRMAGRAAERRIPSRAIRARYATWLASRPPRAEVEAIALLIAPVPRVRRADPHRPSRRGRRAAAAARRARGRAADHGRDLPALPDVLRRRDPRRRDPVQVRAADPRPREPRGAVAGARRRRHRSRRDRSLAVPAGDEGRRRFRRGVGRHRVARAVSLPAMWTGASARGVAARAPRAMALRRAGAAGRPPRSRHHRGRAGAPTSSSGIPTRRSSSIERGCASGTSGRRTTASRCAAACSRPTSAAVSCMVMPGLTPRMSEFTHLIDLASARLGGEAVAANDDFFAEKENLLKPEPPVFIPGKYTDRGKWMDGWESRRRRTPGHDWCIVQLGLPGRRPRVRRRHRVLPRQLSVALLDRRLRPAAGRRSRRPTTSCGIRSSAAASWPATRRTRSQLAARFASRRAARSRTCG